MRGSELQENGEEEDNTNYQSINSRTRSGRLVQNMTGRPNCELVRSSSPRNGNVITVGKRAHFFDKKKRKKKEHIKFSIS